MSMDIIIGAAGVGLALQTAIIAAALRWGRAEASTKAGEEALAEARAARDGLAAFEARVAREYATQEMLANLELRLARPIDEMSRRLERIDDRLERWIEQGAPRRRAATGN